MVNDVEQGSVNEERQLTETLQEKPKVTKRLSIANILNLIDPEQYTGLCSYFAQEFSRKAQQKSLELLGD